MSFKTAALSALVAFIVVAFVTNCKAQTTVGLHLVSHHFPQRDYQNNTNPGIYVRTESGLTAGIYRNTLEHPQATVRRPQRVLRLPPPVRPHRAPAIQPPGAPSSRPG